MIRCEEFYQKTKYDAWRPRRFRVAITSKNNHCVLSIGFFKNCIQNDNKCIGTFVYFVIFVFTQTAKEQTALVGRLQNNVLQYKQRCTDLEGKIHDVLPFTPNS